MTKTPSVISHFINASTAASAIRAPKRMPAIFTIAVLHPVVSTVIPNIRAAAAASSRASSLTSRLPPSLPMRTPLMSALPPSVTTRVTAHQEQHLTPTVIKHLTESAPDAAAVATIPVNASTINITAVVVASVITPLHRTTAT